MKLVSAPRLETSRRFLQTHARELDRSLAEYYFWSGSASAVRSSLQTFQNSDGGFGNAIEPDFRLVESSPMATTVGLQYAGELGLPADDPIVEHAVLYLLSAFDAHLKRWQAVPPSVNDVPHAPWWGFNVETGRCGVEGNWANPNAEILGYLWKYKSLVPDTMLHLLTDVALQELKKLPEKIDFHDFLCYQRLLEFLPAGEKTAVIDRLNRSLLLTVDLDPSNWSSYGTKPLQVATSPASPFAELLRDTIELNLDYEIEQMNEDGSFSPNWSWFGAYEDTWKVAEVEWKGYLTVKTLKSLHDFGRLEQGRF